jgi:hypothetical protein
MLTLRTSRPLSTDRHAQPDVIPDDLKPLARKDGSLEFAVPTETGPVGVVVARQWLVSTSEVEAKPCDRQSCDLRGPSNCATTSPRADY